MNENQSSACTFQAAPSSDLIQKLTDFAPTIPSVLLDFYVNHNGASVPLKSGMNPPFVEFFDIEQIIDVNTSLLPFRPGLQGYLIFATDSYDYLVVDLKASSNAVYSILPVDDSSPSAEDLRFSSIVEFFQGLDISPG